MVDFEAPWPGLGAAPYLCPDLVVLLALAVVGSLLAVGKWIRARRQPRDSASCTATSELGRVSTLVFC